MRTRTANRSGVILVTAPELLTLARQAERSGQRGLSAELTRLAGRLGALVPGDVDEDDGETPEGSEARGLLKARRLERVQEAARIKGRMGQRGLLQ